MIVTFYSFKGGVGRSMALANVAEIIANLGYDVVAIDWDLEAPGLERYFAPSRDVADEWTARPGLMDLLNEYKEGLRTGVDVARPEPAQSPIENATGLEIIASGMQTVRSAADYTMLGSMSVRRPASFAKETPPAIDREGRVRLLTAGSRYGAARSNYIKTIQGFDWQEFYSEWAGASYFEFFRRDLFDDYHGRRPDVVLIDSRTGVTEQGGVCTHHLADLVVLLTAANDLNVDGTEWMAKQLSRPELVEMRGNRPLSVLPVATRIEQTAQTRELAEFQAAMADRFTGYLPSLLHEPQRFFNDTEIPYIPYYSFQERVAARESVRERSKLLYRAYEALAEHLVRWGVANHMLETRASIVRSEPAPSVIPPVADVEARRRGESEDAADALRVAWDLYSAAVVQEHVRTRAARRREFLFSLALAVAAVLVCVVPSVVALEISSPIAVAGSVLIGLGVLQFGPFRSSPEAAQGRSVAEAMKSECYRYAAHVPPYEGARAWERLLEFVSRASIQSGLTTSAPDTFSPAPPMPLGRADYIAQRIDNPRSWFRARAAVLKQEESVWNLLSLSSFMIAFLSSFVPNSVWLAREAAGSWAPGLSSLFLVLGLVILAHVRQRGSGIRARSYLVTVQRLDTVLRKWSIVSDPTPGDFNKLVNDVESILTSDSHVIDRPALPEAT